MPDTTKDNTTKVLVIKNWRENFEHADMRKCKTMSWVRLPIDLNSTGLAYIKAAAGKHWYGIFGIWCLMLEAAASKTIRGIFIKLDGDRIIPITLNVIAETIRVEENEVRKAVKILLSEQCGWLEELTLPELLKKYSDVFQKFQENSRLDKEEEREKEREREKEGRKPPRSDFSDESFSRFPGEVKAPPESIAEIQEVANQQGYAMSDEQAEKFKSYYGSFNWKCKNGQLITNWHEKLKSWNLTEKDFQGQKQFGKQPAKPLPDASKFEKMESEI